jgi:hypothetical protein
VTSGGERMGNRKLCGFDVNGWRDGVARNWVARPGDEEEIGVVRIVEGAVMPGVVQVGTGKDSRWIGGAQADLAPHGRGGGWGEIGKPERRFSVSSLIQTDSSVPAILAAAFSGLAQGASHSVAAIEDSDRTSEPMQERMFAALSSARAGKSLLVWRSVLSVLHALEDGALKGTARDGAIVGVIGHVGAGFSVQTLRIRADNRGGDLDLAPERRQLGRLVASSLGYEGLVSAASNQIMAMAPYRRADHFRSARSIGRLAFGMPTWPEPLRRANGDWDILTPPKELDLLPADLGEGLKAALQACDIILFESLTEGLVRAAVLERVRSDLSRPVTALPATSVAGGALIAAERHAAGRTVYFDFLPRIATIVQGQEGAVSYDLIDDAETLPAGNVYRSPRPARFELEAGKERFQVYLRKETQKAPRMAVIEVGMQLQRAVPVDMWVEQMPAAGRAKILMQAPTLSRQFTVDWDTAEVLDSTWEELLADLATPPPTIPKRLVLPCGLFAWNDSPRGPGLITLLAQNARKTRPDWEELATKMSARPQGHYCISSDGQVPPDAPVDAVEQLNDLTQRAVFIAQRMADGAMAPDTTPLRFLTWQFRRCPREVASLLLDAWDARSRGRTHPFATSPQAWILIRQGLGRIVRGRDHEAAALASLLRTPASAWARREETAAAAFLLSRSDDCPPMLERADVDRLGARVIAEFDENHGSEYTRFNYAPFLLVGLLRWRMKSARALVAGHDPLADAFVRVVERAADDMTRRARRLPKLQQVAARWLPILSATLDELRGSGQNPDLLVAIHDA